MTDDKMPPLPEPVGTRAWGRPEQAALYTGEQMHAYARQHAAALAARVAELERDAARLQWLSDHITRKPADIGSGCMWMFVSKDKPANLRAAIDSAMGDRT